MVINRKASSNASTSATVHKGNYLKVTKNSSQNFSSVNSAKLANKEIVIVAEE